MARSSRIPRAAIWSTQRSPIAGYPTHTFAALVREHAGLGERVRIRRDGFAYYDIIDNGGAFLVLSSMVDAAPVGTYGDVCAAILMGDRHVEMVRRGEFDAEGDLDPRGAA